MTERRLYCSIEELLQPETFSNLTQQPITTTCLSPFKTLGPSSTESQFLTIDACDVGQPRYILKRIRQDQDWVMQATEDWHWRAIAIWQHGLLDRMPEEIGHGIIACTVDEEGYAILMRNVSHTLLPHNKPLSEEDNAFILDALAALHVAFWENRALDNPVFNLCQPENYFSHTSPEKIRRIAETNSSFVLEMILEGWRQMPKFVDADVADLVFNLVHDPSPLCKALVGYPHTLVHSDVHRANLGIERGERPQLILLDWTRPILTVPTVDLAYYLALIPSRSLPTSFEQAIEIYKQRLISRLGDRFNELWWQPQLELSLLGAFLLMGCFKAYFAAHADSESQRVVERADLGWWSEQARAGARWLV